VPQSIVGRVFGLYTITLLGFVGSGLGLFYFYQSDVELEAAQDRAETLAAVMLPTLSDSAVIGDDDTLQRTLERVIFHSSFASASFIDTRGRELKALREEPPRAVPPDWVTTLVARRLKDVSRAVTVGGRDYGILRLSFAPEVVAGDLWRPARAALLLAVLSLVGGLLLIRLPLVSWLGQVGRLRSLEKDIDRPDARWPELPRTEDDNETAPIEFRQTFEVLNRAARSLQAQREQAAVTLKTIGDAVFTLDAEGVVLLVNPAAGLLLRSATSQLLGRPVQSLFPTFFEAAAPLVPWHRREFEFTARDGHSLVIDSTLSPIRGSDGRPVGHVLACRDVTDQHALAQQLRRELASREAALDALRALLVDLSRAGISETLHGALEEGVDPSAAAVGPDSAHGPVGVAAVLAPGGASGAGPGTGRDHEDDIRAVSLLVVDLVAQVRERSEQLNAIFALSPDGFVSFDPQRRVQYASPAFTRLTGLAESRVAGLGEADFVRLLAAGCRPGTSVCSLETLRGQSAYEEGTQCERIELERPLPRVLQVGLRESGSEAISQILYLRDITHETEVERIKSEFLSTAAHELRTPMTSIYGFAELLLHRELAAERRREVLQIIHRQTGRMIAIINELLDLARIEARQGQDFSLETLDLGALVRDALLDFRPPDDRAAPLLQGLEGLGARVCVDRGKLLQALGNVLSNAYKYSPGGGAVRVSLFPGRLPGRDGGPAWGLDVEDEGIGMTPEQLARVSERFYRADTSGSIPGTGLGMSIVQEIVGLLGGVIELGSESGKGTRVRLWLPAAAAEIGDPLRPQGLLAHQVAAGA
jgi:PAS domain S-box-containing protein